MNGVIKAGAALILSLGANAALVWVLTLAIAPEPVDDQEVPEMELNISRADAPQSTAVAASPDSPTAPAQTPSGAMTSANTIPSGPALPLTRVPDPARTAAPDIATAVDVSLPATVLSARTPETSSAPEGGMRSATQSAESLSPDAVSVTPADAMPRQVVASRPARTTAPEATTVAPRLVPTVPAVASAGAAQPVATITAPSARASTRAAASAVPPVSRAVPIEAPATAAPQGRTATATARVGDMRARPAPQPLLAGVELVAQRPPDRAGPSVSPTSPLTPPSPAPRRSGDAILSSAPAAPAHAPDLRPAPPRAPHRQSTPALRPVPTASPAALSWSGAADLRLDPQSLNALQTFLAPGTPDSLEMRDRIAALLVAPPCSRLQTRFNSETGALELAGHLPEAGMAAPIVTALSAQMGDSLSVQDTTRILPAPPCAALARMDDMPVPQSDEHNINQALIGVSTFATAYSFAGGDRLMLTLRGPSYPSFLYVDYYDASGQVLHLQPNDQVPLRALAPDEAAGVGQSLRGEPALNLIVRPPFGQEMAVALATSVPVFDALRPLTEPATDYLDALQARLSQLAGLPGFKGEWAYFLIRTGPTD